MVTAGYDFAAAVVGGRLLVWGDNRQGQLGLGSGSATAGFRARRRGHDDEQRQDIFTSPFTPDEPRFLAGARHNRRNAMILLLDVHEVAMCGVRAHMALSGAVLLSGSIPRIRYDVLPLTEPVTRPPYCTISCVISSRSSESCCPVTTNVLPARQPSAPTGSFLQPALAGASRRGPSPPCRRAAAPPARPAGGQRWAESTGTGPLSVLGVRGGAGGGTGGREEAVGGIRRHSEAFGGIRRH